MGGRQSTNTSRRTELGVAESDLVTLNVGGTLYTTTIDTMTRHTQSSLWYMYFDPIPYKDSNGHYIIDGDGPIFRHVLNFLRRSSLCLPHDFKEWDLLSAEAEFYMIRELMDAVKSLKKKRSSEGSRQEMEFIEMSFFVNESKEVTSYRGTAVTLKASPTLWSYFQSDDPLNATAIIDYVNANGSYSASSDKEVDRMKIYQEMTRLGFKLLNTSIRESSQVQVTLFGRNKDK